MRRESLSMCHLTSESIPRWYGLKLCTPTVATVDDCIPVPNRGTSAVVVIGAEFVSWRERVNEEQTRSFDQFIFEEVALVSSQQLVWSRVDYHPGRVAQAWITKQTWHRLMGLLADFRIHTVVAEPLSVRSHDERAWRSGNVFLSYPSGQLSANIESVIPGDAEFSDTLSGHTLDLARGVMKSRENECQRGENYSRFFTFGVVGLAAVSIVAHLLYAYFSLSSKSSEQQSTIPATQWLQQMASKEVLLGQIKSLRAKQFGTRLEIELNHPISNDAVAVIEEVVGKQYAAARVGSDQLIIMKRP